MATLVSRLESDLDQLISMGDDLLRQINPKECTAFWSGYQTWYTRAVPAIRLLAPDRLNDFTNQYCPQKRSRLTSEAYVLEDYVRGMSSTLFNSHNVAVGRFFTQLKILTAAKGQLSDVLANIRGLMQADLFDSELDAARELRKNGYLRAAGAVAGVVLEGHLKELVQKHQVTLGLGKNRKATISDYNEALKKANVFNIPTWRGIQHLGDIRNLCDHKSSTEPTADEVDELIRGTDKAIKTLA